MFRVVLPALFTAFLVIQTVHAMRALPPVLERYVLVADSWKLHIKRDWFGFGPGAQCQVEVSRGAQKLLLPIDLLFLASRIDSNLLCTGGGEGKMIAYLESVQKQHGRQPLVVEVASLEKGGKLFDAGLWLMDDSSQYKSACQYGSDLLNLDAARVRALGDAIEYRRKLVELSDRDWDTLSQRRAKKLL